MSTARKILDTVILFLTAVAMLVDALFLWYTIDHRNDTSVSTAFVTELKTNVKEDASAIEAPYGTDVSETPVLEVNYYSHEDDTDGVALAELRFNYYTDVERNEVYQAGYQYVGAVDVFNDDLYDEWLSALDLRCRDAGYQTRQELYDAMTDAERSAYLAGVLFSHPASVLRDDPDVDLFTQPRTEWWWHSEPVNIDASPFTQYDGYQDNSWLTSSSTLTPGQLLIVEIDGELYGIRCNKATVTKIDRGFLGIKTGERQLYKTYAYLMDAIMDAVRSNSLGTQVQKLPLKLSPYFTIQRYNAETKRFEDLAETDQEDVYFTVSVNYNVGGATTASQSFFCSIGTNSVWTSESITTDYWQARSVYTLDHDDFIYRESEIYGGKLVSVKDTVKERLNDIPSAEIDIWIDAVNCVGVDINGFRGLKNVREIYIYNSGQDHVTFSLLSGSLIDTGAQRLTDDGTDVLTIEILAGAHDDDLEVSV